LIRWGRIGSLGPMDEIATPAQIEEFQTLYGLDPEMLENILWSQASHAKAGREMTLEDTYFLEVDGNQRDAWERQRQSPNEQFSVPWSFLDSKGWRSRWCGTARPKRWKRLAKWWTQCSDRGEVRCHRGSSNWPIAPLGPPAANRRADRRPRRHIHPKNWATRSRLRSMRWWTLRRSSRSAAKRCVLPVLSIDAR
jgi:hypothetical protein